MIEAYASEGNGAARKSGLRPLEPPIPLLSGLETAPGVIW